jgi:hypothetical protein
LIELKIPHFSRANLDNTFIQNVCIYLGVHTVSQPRTTSTNARTSTDLEIPQDLTPTNSIVNEENRKKDYRLRLPKQLLKYHPKGRRSGRPMKRLLNVNAEIRNRPPWPKFVTEYDDDDDNLYRTWYS